MTDDPGKNPSPPEPGDSGGEVVSAQELDDLLSEASALAREISSDLGTPTSEPGQDRPAGPGTPAVGNVPELVGDPKADVDTQLAYVDDLLREAGTQLGLDDDLRAPDHPAAAAPQPGGQHTLALPPAESDGPAPPQEPAEEETTDGLLSDNAMAQSVDGPVDTDAGQAVVEAAADPAADQRQSEDDDSERPLMAPASDAPETKAFVRSEGNAGTESGADKPPARGARRTWAEHLPVTAMVRRVAGAVAPAMERAGERTVRLLELLDRPTRGLNREAREVIGWIAIATLATSAIVFLVSLF